MDGMNISIGARDCVPCLMHVLQGTDDPTDLGNARTTPQGGLLPAGQVMGAQDLQVDGQETKQSKSDSGHFAGIMFQTFQDN